MDFETNPMRLEINLSQKGCDVRVGQQAEVIRL
jgi:hypothetical protein